MFDVIRLSPECACTAFCFCGCVNWECRDDIVRQLVRDFDRTCHVLRLLKWCITYGWYRLIVMLFSHIAHERLLRPYFRHCSSAAHAICQLSSAVQLLVLICGGSVAWNSLPDYLLDPTHFVDSFRHDLKTFLFLFCEGTQCIIGGFAIMHCINLLLTLTAACS